MQSHEVHLIFAAVAGAVAYVVGADIYKPRRALLYVLCGATTAVFTAPALADRFGIQTERAQMAFSFLVGLIGVTVTRAITRWFDRNTERLIGELARRFSPSPSGQGSEAEAPEEEKPQGE